MVSRQRVAVAALVALAFLVGMACAVSREERVPEGPETPLSSSPEPKAAPTPLSDQELAVALSGALFSPQEWKTNFRLFTVPLSEVQSGGPPKDGIPAIDNPKLVSLAQAGEWLDDREPVQVVELNGEARAYPLQVLMWHEIVNDEVGGVPVTVTFCPLCNAGITFRRTLDGRVLDFGTTGNLRFSDLVMYDRQTESWWQQLTGEAIVGDLTGKRLGMVPSQVIAWGEFRRAYPGGKVLSRDTGFSRSYGVNPYTGYDTAYPFLFQGPTDERLGLLERVVTVSIGDQDVAFPFSVLEKEPVVHYSLGDQELVVLYKKGTASALDDSSIARSRDVGAAGVFDPRVKGRSLTFHVDGENFVDRETDTIWNLAGQAVEGRLKGERLQPILHGSPFWFSWVVFKPSTVVYKG